MTLISVIPAWSYNRECSYGSLGIAMIGHQFICGVLFLLTYRVCEQKTQYGSGNRFSPLANRYW